MSKGIAPFNSERLLATLQRLPATKTYWVGYSGGADSSALLFALAELRSRLDAEIIALHVNHGLHKDSAAWESFCEETCTKLGIKFKSRTIHISGKSGSGIEAEARHQRYGLVEQLLGNGDVFLTAHHRDDQAETLILNLLRGSGVDGLAGMPETRPLAKGLLARPLLDHSMESLRTYLEQNGFSWLEDPSNNDQSYDRNFVRHSLLPQLESKWPGASERLATSARHCREASTALEHWADNLLQRHLPHPRVLDMTELNTDGSRFRFLIRRWLKTNDAEPMPARVMQQLCNQAGNVRPESNMRITWQGWEIHWFRQKLWLQEATSIQPCPVLNWNQPGPLSIGHGIGTLAFEPATHRFPANLSVDTRHGGERIQPENSEMHKRVKDILRETGIPPWLRPSVPLVLSAGNVLAVGDLVIGQELSKWLNKYNASLKWQPTDPVLKFALEQTGAR